MYTLYMSDAFFYDRFFPLLFIGLIALVLLVVYIAARISDRRHNRGRKFIFLALLTLSGIVVNAQQKGDDVIMVRGTVLDSVIKAFHQSGYHFLYVVPGTSANMQYAEPSPFGTALINIYIYKALDSLIDVTASVGLSNGPVFPLKYANGWQKQFVKEAAIAAESGGKIEYWHKIQ